MLLDQNPENHYHRIKHQVYLTGETSIAAFINNLVNKLN